RGSAVRRRRAQWRAGGQRHDRRADRAGHAYGCRRRAVVFQEERTCFAFAVAAPRRKARSVPVETYRAPILTNSAVRLGWELNPPTPRCFPCLRHASIALA